MRNVSDQKVVEKIKTGVLYSISFFFRRWFHLWDNVGKYGRAVQATDDDMTHAHYMLDNWRCKHTLKICNTYWFPTATIIQQKRVNSMLQYIVRLVSSVSYRVTLKNVAWKNLNFLETEWGVRENILYPSAIPDFPFRIHHYLTHSLP